jgi:ABC-type amino acid transport substrate-binding protein
MLSIEGQIVKHSDYRQSASLAWKGTDYMQRGTKNSLAVIGILILALAGGCVGARFQGGDGSSAATQGSWLNDIKGRGELRVGVAIAPPMTVQQGGKLGGPNLIPLEDLAKQMGVKLTPVPATWGNIVAGLQANRYDVAANLDATLERALSISFSDAVYEYQGVFVVPPNSRFSKAADIVSSGQPVAVAQGSAPGAAVAAAGAKTLELGDYTGAFQAMRAGRAVALFTDLPTAESQVQSNPGFKIIVPDPKIYEASAGYGLPQNIDTRSMQIVNIAINTARMSGRMERAYAEVGYLTIDRLGDMQKIG